LPGSNFAPTVLCSMTLESIPDVPGANLMGHGHLFRDDRLALLRSAADAGPISRIRFLHRWVLFANSAEAAHEVLVERARSFEKSPGLRIVLHDLAGDGLFTSEGPLWQRQRRLMSPLFHAGALASYAKTMNEVARRALGRLREGDVVDIAREMTRITMSVVAETLFGTETDAEADELGRALTVALAWVDEHLASSLLALQVTLVEALEKTRPILPQRLSKVRAGVEKALEGPVLLPGRRDAEFQWAVRTFDRKIRTLIDERRAHPNGRVDLLTKLLTARDVVGDDGMSDHQIRDETVTLFVAGHETTANALAWTFYLLARNPEARARVQAEVDALEPEAAGEFAPEKLPYTTRVFKETLRMYPPVIVLPRRSLEPIELGGRSYPERTLAFVNVYGIHMSPRTWDDPDRFEPDRFVVDREAQRHKSAWMPFGVGPRVCIGTHFALMEGPIILATLMRGARFDIDPARTIEPDSSPALRPKGGLPAVVHRRDTLP
jgi:cytochrome P450